MSSKSFGTPYEVLERLGKYQPRTICFKKDSVDYCYISDNTANLSEDSEAIEKDYEKTTKVIFKKR